MTKKIISNLITCILVLLATLLVLFWVDPVTFSSIHLFGGRVVYGLNTPGYVLPICFIVAVIIFSLLYWLARKRNIASTAFYIRAISGSIILANLVTFLVLFLAG